MFLAYLICFGAGLLFTLASVVLGEMFGGHGGHGGDIGSHGHADVGFDAGDGMPGFSPLSPTVVASFITAFGGFGMIFHQIDATDHPLVSSSLSTLCGFGVATGVFYLFRTIFIKTQASSESRVGQLVGKQAVIITPIPENGVGEIAYVVGQTRYTAPAREEGGVAVANGRAVTITRVVGSQFFVKQS